MSKNYILIVILMLVSVFSKADDDFGYTSKPNCKIAKQVVPFGGTFNVGSFGNASYTIPIEVPAGVNGMQPSLSITYDSQAGNGLVGYGCNLDGFSKITRGGKDPRYDDGNVSGISFNNNQDTYYLDGQRLLLKPKSGEIDRNSGEYYLENDLSVRVLVHASKDGAQDNVGNVQKSWEVILADGTKMFYGQYADSRSMDIKERYTMAWCVCRMEDVHGNYVTYSYIRDKNSPYNRLPKKITYGKNERYYLDEDNSTLVNEIDFIYETRDDVIYSWTNGVKVCQDKRLKSIETKTNGNLFRTYTMSYGHPDNVPCPYSKLSKIYKSNGDGEMSDPIVFSWNYLPSFEINVHNMPVTMKAGEVTVTSINKESFGDVYERKFTQSRNFYTADLNGDGVSDLIEVNPIECSLKKSNSGNEPQTYISTLIVYPSVVNRKTGNVSFGEGKELLTNMNCWDKDRDFSVMISDFNRDGIQDLIIVHLPKDSRKVKVGVIYGSKTLSDLSINPLFTFDAPINGVMPLFSVFDYNNDGVDELAFFNTTDNKDLVEVSWGVIGEFRPRTSSTTARKAGTLNVVLDDECPYDCTVLKQWMRQGHNAEKTKDGPKAMYVDDYNVDGLSDIMLLFEDHYKIYYNRTKNKNLEFECYSYSSLKYHANMAQGDFDGDGCSDFVYRNGGGYEWKIAYGKKDGTFEEVTAMTYFGIDDDGVRDSNRDEAWVVLPYDMNRDGKMDLFVNMGDYDKTWGWDWYAKFRKNCSYWLVSTGKRETDNVFLRKKDGVESNDSYDVYGMNYTIGDFDGDGQLELFNYGYDCYNGIQNRSAHLYKTDGYSVNSGKVHRISDALGNSVDIEYKSLANSDIYSEGSNSEFPMVDCVAPIHAVSKTCISNGSLDSDVTEYKYKGLKIHLNGLGALGFEQIVSNNKTKGLTITTNVDEWNTEHYVPSKTSTITTIKDGEKTYEKKTESYVHFVPTELKMQYFSCPLYKIDTDIYGHKTRTDYVYDYTKGVPLSEKVTIDGKKSSYKEVTYSDYQKINGVWQPSIIASSQLSDDDSEPFVNKTYYEYDKNGILKKQVERYESSKPVTTKYTYDRYGNVLTTTVEGNDIDSIRTIKEYDASNRFVVKTYTEPALVTKEYTYDDFGRCLTSTEYAHENNRHTTTYEYDGWGNCVRTVNPDGTIDVVQTGFDSSNTRYYVLEQGTGKPWSLSKYDVTGRKLATETISANDVHICEFNKYNQKGNVVQVDKIFGYNVNIDTYVDSYSGENHSINSYSYSGENHIIDRYSYDAFGQVTSYERIVPDSLCYVATDKDGNVTKSGGRKYGVVQSITPVESLARSRNGGEDIVLYKPLPDEPFVPIKPDYSGIWQYETFRTVKKVSYMYGDCEQLVIADGKEYYKELDVWGNLLQIQDPVSNVVYFYSSNGKPYMIDAANDETDIEYDDVGNRIAMQTSDAGRITYEYNTRGDLVKSVNAKGVQTKVLYDKYGRVKSKTIGDTKISYVYFTSSENNGKLGSIIKSVKGTATSRRIFSYDNFGRIVSVHIYNHKNNKNKYIKYAYDDIGQLCTITYPNSVVVDYEYDCYGNKKRILVNGKEAYRITQSNGRDFSALFSEKIKIKEKYDISGHLTSRRVSKFDASNDSQFEFEDFDGALPVIPISSKTDNDDENTLLSLQYGYDEKTDNMIFRSGMMDDVEESFEYDELDRLVSYYGLDGQSKRVEYDGSGNITFKTDLGAFDYASSAHPHRLTEVENEEENISKMARNITYNDLSLVSLIEDATELYSMSFDYGVDNERMVSVLKKGNATLRTVYSYDNYEEVVENGKTSYYYYLGDNLIYIKQNGVGKLYLACGDHLGSIVRVFDEDANVVFKAKYDAWGVQECEINSISLRRGYIGQEEMPEFGLVNLNARLYDPMLGRFISPDNFVQSPENSQNYNRYAYCINNPLKFSDPSGNLFGIDDFLIAVAVSAAVNAVATYAAGGSGKDVLRAAAWGALEGAATYGVGSLFSGAKVGTLALKALAHGAVGSGISALQGNGFSFSSFAVSSLSSFAASGASIGMGKLAGKIPSKFLRTLSMHAASALVGGGTAVATGSNFWGGCARALVISTFNHAMHDDDVQVEYDENCEQEPYPFAPYTERQKNSENLMSERYANAKSSVWSRLASATNYGASIVGFAVSRASYNRYHCEKVAGQVRPYWTTASGKHYGPEVLRKVNGKYIVKGAAGIRYSMEYAQRAAKTLGRVGNALGGIGIACSFYEISQTGFTVNNCVSLGLSIGAMAGGPVTAAACFAGGLLWDSCLKSHFE